MKYKNLSHYLLLTTAMLTSVVMSSDKIELDANLGKVSVTNDTFEVFIKAMRNPKVTLDMKLRAMTINSNLNAQQVEKAEKFSTLLKNLLIKDASGTGDKEEFKADLLGSAILQDTTQFESLLKKMRVFT
jgi:hypothetical protein